MLSDYLKEEWIKLEVEAENWEDAIEKAGIDLVRDKIIRRKYIEAMKKTVREIGPYFVITKNVAIPHARSEEGAIKTGVSLVTLKNPVNFGNTENDPVKYIFCLSVKNDNEHIEILKDLSELLEDKEFFRLLESKKNREEIYKYIKYKKS